MVNYLKNLCIFYSVNRLISFIVINKNNLLSSWTKEISSWNSSYIITVFILYREIPEPFLSHNLLNIFNIICCLETYNSVSWCHKESNRNCLIHKPCNSICIIISFNNNTVMALCNLGNCIGYLCPLTYYKTFCLHLYCTELWFVSVTKNYNISLINHALHHIRVSRCNKHLSFVKYLAFITCNYSSPKCFNNISKTCLSIWQYSVIKCFKIRFGNVINWNKTCKFSAFCNRKCYNIKRIHQFPCIAHRNLSVYSLCMPYLYIHYLWTYIFNIFRSLYTESVQYKMSFLIKMSRPLRHIIICSGYLIL